jgi:hypothetical protein
MPALLRLHPAFMGVIRFQFSCMWYAKAVSLQSIPRIEKADSVRTDLKQGPHPVNVSGSRLSVLPRHCFGPTA